MKTPVTPAGKATFASRWLAWPRVSWLALGAALLVSLTVFRAGLFADDYIYLGILSGQRAPAPLSNSTFDLYRFIEGNPATSMPLVDKGIFPWWTLPELKMAFWRPLTSVTMAVDHALFGTNTAGYQAHSVLWYLALVAVFSLLMRRTLPGGVGALALLLFAIDDSHSVPVGWWSNRNAIVAALPALVGLWLHLEWREHGRKWAAPLSLLALAVGLAGGEAALGVFAYVLAYEVLGARGPWRQRLLAVLPVSLLALGYLALYKALGYGTFGSDLYLDPVGQTADWAKAAVVRIPALLWGLLLSLPSEITLALPGMEWVTIGVGLGGLALVGGLLRAVWPHLSEDERRHSLWLLTGALLALLPVSSITPGNRLLLVPSLGAVAVVAMVLTHVWRNRARSGGWRVLTGLAGVLALTHILLAPVGWFLTTYTMGIVSDNMVRLHQLLERDLDMAALPGQRVAVLTLPNPTLSLYTSIAWWARGKPLPRAWWALSCASDTHRVTRTGPNTLELELVRDRFFDTEHERAYRSGHFPLTQGMEVKLEGMTVKVAEVDARGVKRLSYTFDVPLEDPSLVLLHWKDDALKRLPAPEPGTTLTLHYDSPPSPDSSTAGGAP